MGFCPKYSCPRLQPGLAQSEGKGLYGSVSLWQVKLYPLAVVLPSREGEITKHNPLFCLSTAFLLLLMHSCRKVVTSVLGGGWWPQSLPAFDTAWPSLQYNVLQRLKFQERCSQLCAACWAPASQLLPAPERRDTAMLVWTEQWVNKQRQNSSWLRRNSAGVTFARG